jgi:aminopeptidase N
VQAEDVSLFRRSDRRTIALYASVAKLAARGRFYSDDTSREYDVLDYNVEAYIDPRRQLVEGRARLAIRVRSTSVSTLLLRLADPFVVSSVTSVEYGRLLHFRLRNQNMILVNMPRTLVQDSDLTLVVSYAGRLFSQNLDIDTIQTGEAPPPIGASSLEQSYLLSNQSFWYPQNPIPDYATATIRITTPEEYSAVASGEPVAADQVVSLRDIITARTGNVAVFRANQPLRYLAVLVGRFTRVGQSRIEFTEETGGAGDPMTLAVNANPRLQYRGRNLMRPAEDILRFYTSLVGDAPYASATIALVESALPGGHSPAYFSMLNEPQETSSLSWRGDPAMFEGFPDFFLAHELAHQWWGQAIGWKNYHEQWLSEGFSQYFAAMYAQKTRGDRVFVDMLRQFRRWSLAESDQGPIYLGYRLGHINSDLRVFRALVYNKGAAVLHMLRRLLGDKVFFAGIRAFYEDRRYQKAGTDDFERAMEAASGRVLDRFFERWIYGQEMPRVSYRAAIADNQVTLRFEQTSAGVFDIPVTVTLVYANGRTADVMVPVTDRQIERVLPTEGRVREVQVNRDAGSLAEFNEQ